MSPKQPDFRRYLVPVNTGSTQQLFTDCLVVGAGVAGLRAALEAAEQCDVTLVCKGALSDSNTWKPRAASPTVLAIEDSLRVAYRRQPSVPAAAISDKTVVERVVKEVPA
jgi:L-aspartate oxidase